MKYYAVTDDPNELLHYGVKGMKWGQHIFGDKPRSAGYHRALGKLRGFASKTKSSIQKSSQQRAINKQNKQLERYNKAVQKAQQRVSIIEGLNNLNKMRSFEDSMDRTLKEERRAEKAAIKQQRKFAKNEKHMDKYLQEAREGRLRYGKLSDDQVRQITDRLAIERSARALGNTEKPKFKLRLKDALQEGILQGTVGGTAAGMTEIARAKIQNKYKNRRILDEQASQRAKREHDANRIRSKRSAKEVREDLRQEAYEAEVRDGQHGFWSGTKSAAKSLKNIEAKQHEEQRIRNLQDRLNNERDEKWNNYLAENNMTEKQMLKFHKGQSKEQILVGEEKLKKQNEEVLDKQAYNKIAEQTKAEVQHRINIESQEKENAKLKENYESDMEQYRKNKEHDDRLKDKYSKDMEKYNREMSDYTQAMTDYNRDYAIYTNRINNGISAKPPKKPISPVKPNKPTYINPKEPAKPKYHKIDYDFTPQTYVPSYDEFRRLQRMGYNLTGGSKNNKGNKNNKR